MSAKCRRCFNDTDLSPTEITSKRWATSPRLKIEQTLDSERYVNAQIIITFSSCYQTDEEENKLISTDALRAVADRIMFMRSS